MNLKDKQIFLNLISSLVPEDGHSIYQSNDENGNSFYFYTGLDCKLRFTATGNNIHVNFILKNETVQHSISYEFSEIKELMEDIFNKYAETKASDFLHVHKITLKDLDEDIEFINQYLKNIDLEDEFRITDDELVLNLKNGDKEYLLRIGRVFHDLEKPQDILYIAKIPFNIEQKNKSRIYIDYMLPGWEIAQYKAFKWARLDNGIQSIDDFREKIKETNPQLASIFMAYTLENDLSVKTPIKGKKI